MTTRLDDHALQKGGTMKKVIYLDNAATTKVRPEVVEAMLPFYTEYYGNPSAVYEFSTPCKEALAKARETVAKSLGAKDNEIYFTNGGIRVRQLGSDRDCGGLRVKRKNTSSQQRSSIMQFSIPVNIWRNAAQRSHM